jgi:hypothetical protein
MSTDRITAAALQIGGMSNSRWVPEFGDGCLPTRFCLDQGL